MNCEIVLRNIHKFLIHYIKEHDVLSLVVGVSGGIDSALICAISGIPCEKCDIPLIGVHLPSSTNQNDEIERARLVGRAFCTEFHEIFIDEIFHQMKGFLGYPDNKIRLGNCKARIRMIKLYDVAKATSGLVLSTDNLTELNLGFWTLHGDVGDLGLIQNLWKTEVYELAQYMVDDGIEELKSSPETRANALVSCIKATPTDGLGITNSDLDQIGVESYEEVDKILQSESEDFNNPVVLRHFSTSFKRENPVNISRDIIFKEVI